MAQQRAKFSVTVIAGLYLSSKRSLAFVEGDNDDEINARKVYVALKESSANTLRNRFDYWLQGGVYDKYFHGWSDPKYRECFVFKWDMRNQHQRLYGFLTNPKPRTNRAFQVCVLVSHAQKNTRETDPAELDHINLLRVRQEVIEAVKIAYPEDDLH